MESKSASPTFGVIVATRGIFSPRLASEGRAALLAVLDRLGYGYVIPAKGATPNGAIETRRDAAVAAALFQANRERIDGVIVSLPNFGDELGVVETLERADLGVPILVHAFDDEIDKVGLADRRDAFCGKISVCNNLDQYGIPWTDTTEHTSGMDDPAFALDLDRFARICRVVRGLRGARIGAIGTRPAAFQTVRYSEKLLQGSGITVVPVDLSEILAAAESIRSNTKELAQKLEAIRAYGTIPARIGQEQVLRQARLSVAIDRWMAENDCDASAVQCWTSLEKNYGCAACLSMSMMSEALSPSACEVDVTGAVSMYALALVSGQPAAFLDWNNNYGRDREMCVNTHCSNFPRSFVGGEIEISELDVLGESLGRERCFGAVKGRVKAGPMTFFRMDTDDRAGAIRGYLGQGVFTDDPFPMDGGIAVCRIPGLRKVLSHVTGHGYEHHVAMVRGIWVDPLREAATKYLGWSVLQPAAETAVV